MNRLSRRFRRKFSAKQSEGSHDKSAVNYKVVLLDGSDLSFDLPKKCRGSDLLEMVFKSLDLVERDYFGLQFMDTHQVSHWLDPEKKIKKQVKIGKPYTLHFRVKFYAAEPDKLNEELTRYHFFLQIKSDVLKGRFNIPCKMCIELAAFSLQSELGDYDAELHGEDYVSEFKFVPHQTKELEKQIWKQHKKNIGLSPADCELSYLTLAKNLDFYGIDLHHVIGDNNVEFYVGLNPRGIVLVREMQILTTFLWPNVNKIMFKKKLFILEIQDTENPMHFNTYRYNCTTSKASKHLWKCAIEHHVFFRLIKPAEKPTRTQSFLRMGSRFRYSGRTEYQASREAKINARKSQKFERARSERFSKRSTIGYIRVGSQVWAKALNGDYYKGIISGLGEKVHIKFDNGDTIAHERSADDCVVYDKDPSPEDVVINMRVIGYWSGIPAKLSGTVIKMENSRYYVHYDDGDKGWNSLSQIRILKPPLYFGPGSNLSRKRIKKSESMKITSLTKTTITTEIAPKIMSPETPSSPIDPTFPTSNGFQRTRSLPNSVLTEADVVDSLLKKFENEQKRIVELPPKTKDSDLQQETKDDKIEKTEEEIVDIPPNTIHENKVESIKNAAKATPPRPPLPKTVDQWNRNPSFAAAISQGMPVDSSKGKSTENAENNISQNKSEYVASRKVSVEKFRKEAIPVIPEEKPLNICQEDDVPQETESDDSKVLESSQIKNDLKQYAIDNQRAFVVYVPDESDKKWDYTKRTTYVAGLNHGNDDLIKILLSPSKQRSRRASLPASLNSSVDNLEEDSSTNYRTKTPDNIMTPGKKSSSLNDLAKISPTHKRTPLNIDNFQKPSSSAVEAALDDSLGINDSWSDDLLPPITAHTHLQRSPSGRKFVHVTDL